MTWMNFISSDIFTGSEEKMQHSLNYLMQQILNNLSALNWETMGNC